MTLFCATGRGDSLAVQGRVVSPTQGIDTTPRIAGTAFLSGHDGDRPAAVAVLSALAGVGFDLVAIEGTACTPRAAGLQIEEGVAATVHAIAHARAESALLLQKRIGIGV